MKSEEIMPDGVTVPQRLRAVDDAKVKQLAQSMEAIGLQQPITCWQDGEELKLVTGAHRLAAAKLLGWQWIDAVFTGADEIDRQLWEIDENLMRSELTPSQRDEHLLHRKKLWEQREIRVARLEPSELGYKKPPPAVRGFAAETADVTGLSKASINKAIARAEAIPEDVRDRVRGTRLDTGVYLDGLKKMTHEQQHEAVTRALDRLEKAPKAAPHAPDPDDDYSVREKQVTALMNAWNRAGKDAREQFLERIGH